MPKAIAHVNGVDYEIKGDFEEHHAQQIADALANRDGGPYFLDVVQDGRSVRLTLARALIWVSGVVLVPTPRSAYEDRGMTVV